MRIQSTTWFVSLIVAILVLIAGSGCAGEQAGERSTPESAAQEPQPSATATAEVTLAQPTSTPQAVMATATAVPSPTVEAPLTFPTFYYGDVAACGQDLPLVTAYDGPIVDSLSPDAAAMQTVLESLPEAARPALDQLLEAPQTVGLAAYRVGEEEAGVYLNGEVPMPLASVVKVIHLVAYAEAVAAGELIPTETVMLEELDRYYYRLDQRAHLYALEDLEADGRIFGRPPALILDEVVHMMIEYSSNAATDYLHMRLGQETIEQTAQELGLQSQTAPCPFVGQFLIMDNHTRPQIDGQTALEFYAADPQRYGEELMQLTAAFSEDAQFHEEALDWRRNTKRPDIVTQRLFSEQFNARGTAVEYAELMARLALNGLDSAESSFITRRHLEWPMRYSENQELFTNLAYKGGALPGILTTVYYAYPIGETNPLVVALFYHDLHNSSYQRWRRSLAHDEFARWLLYEPQAIPAMRALIGSG